MGNRMHRFSRLDVGLTLAMLIGLMLILGGCSSNHSQTEPAATQTSSPTLPASSEPSSPSAEASTSPSAPPGQAPESPTATPSDIKETTTPPKAEAMPTPSAPAEGTGGKQQPSTTPKPQTTPSPKPTEETSKEVIFSIIGNEEWGTIIDGEHVTLKDGDTAASVLKRVAKAHRLAFEISGSGAMTYIEGIDGLYEFDNGPTSGWKYRVNGVVPDIGAGIYELKPGDIVEWIYVLNDELAASGKESE
jgi:hypothetical protein